MRISFVNRLNTTLHQLTQLSSTFKKWWDEPREKGGLSRKEQFQKLFKERPQTAEQLLKSLERYLSKPLFSRNIKNFSPVSPKNNQTHSSAEPLSKVVKELDAVLKEYSTKPLPRPPSQPLPKAIHLAPLPPKPLPKPPQRPLPTPPTKPVPPVPLSEEEMEMHIASLKQTVEAASPLPPGQAPLAGARERAAKLPNLPKNRPLPQPPTQPNVFAAKRPKYVPKHTGPSEVVQKILASGEGSVSFNEIMGINKQIQTLHKEVELLADLAYVLGRGMGKDREELFQYAYNNNANLKDKPETQESYPQNVAEHGAKLQNIFDKYGILPEKEAYDPSKTEAKVGGLIQKLESQADDLQEQVTDWYEKNPLR